MQEIKITEKQKESLVEELANLVIKYKEIKEVESIFMTPIVSNGKGILKVVVVANFVNYCDYIIESFKVTDYNEKQSTKGKLKKHGLELCVCIDTPERYIIKAMNPSEVQNQQLLYNSTILYDKTGKYTQIKKEAEKATGAYKEKFIFYYDNLANIVPPILDDTNKKINIKSK